LIGIGLSLWFTSATLINSLPDSTPIALLVFAVFLQLAQYFYTRSKQAWYLTLTVVLLYGLSVTLSYLFLQHSVSQALYEAQKGTQSHSEQQIVVDSIREKIRLQRELIEDLRAKEYLSKANAILESSTLETELAAAVQALPSESRASLGLAVALVPTWAVKIGLFVLALVLELIIAGALAECRRGETVLSPPVAVPVAEPEPVAEPVIEQEPEPVIETPKVENAPQKRSEPPMAVINNWPDGEYLNVSALRAACGCSERDARAAIDAAKNKKWLIKDGNRLLRKHGLKVV